MKIISKPVLSIILILIGITKVFAQALSDTYPEDENIESSPKVLFHENFENG